ncbi:MAG: hypothetical protein JWN90_365 [Parcubacteria group bacterium]|nr:hypothetical protein [Parcubacteria group bacterium]
MTPTLRNHSILLLRISYVLFLFAIGADKIVHTNLIADWSQFVGPTLHSLLPFSIVTIVSIEGIVEIAIGILFLTKWVRTAGVLVIGTTLLICIDLFTLHFTVIALHDLLFCVGAIVLMAQPSFYRIKHKDEPWTEATVVT